MHLVADGLHARGFLVQMATLKTALALLEELRQASFDTAEQELKSLETFAVSQARALSGLLTVTCYHAWWCQALHAFRGPQSWARPAVLNKLCSGMVQNFTDQFRNWDVTYWAQKQQAGAVQPHR